MTAVQAGLAIAGYTFTVGIPLALIVWGLLQRPLGYGRRPAAYLAIAFAAALVAPLWSGYAVDLAKPNEACNGECYEFVRAWLALPLGWGLAALVVAGAIAAAPRLWARA